MAPSRSLLTHSVELMKSSPSPFSNWVALGVLLLVLCGSGIFQAQASQEPESLSTGDERLYRQIFEHQRKAEWKAADSLINQLSDDVLMGHVLFQRYMHPTGYTSRYAELKAWLAKYSDHSQAHRIYRLALRKRPSGAAGPKVPEKRRYRHDPNYVVNKAREGARRTSSQKNKFRRLERQVRSLLARERPTQALNKISEPAVKSSLHPIDFDRLRYRIAAQYFYERVPQKAYAQAQTVLSRHAAAIPEAHWIAGLASWEMKQFDQAAGHFEKMASAQYLTKHEESAAAFWAARAYLVSKEPAKVTPLLERAAQNKFSFYGVLANTQLGVEHPYDWTGPKLTQTAFDSLLSVPGIARAVALKQVGKDELSEAEFRKAHGKMKPGRDLDLLALATALNLPRAQLEITEYTNAPGFDTGRYPVPTHFAPNSGFKVDRALIYAFMRKESKFDTKAVSWAGARGLLQLMPRTASYVSGDNSLRGANRYRLFDPGFNLDLGQKYLQSLIGRADPTGNMFMVTVAYNGGPTNMRKWRNELNGNANDPLFFVESIPARETRNFIEEVLKNFWIYRDRLGQPSPSLTQTASGSWPVYQRLDPAGITLARN